jgi:hypothetical protein
MNDLDGIQAKPSVVQSPILREVIMRKYALIVVALCCAGVAAGS